MSPNSATFSGAATLINASKAYSHRSSRIFLNFQRANLIDLSSHLKPNPMLDGCTTDELVYVMDSSLKSEWRPMPCDMNLQDLIHERYEDFDRRNLP